MRQDEKGYIVVETITSFLLLVLLMVSILSLVNIVALQARIHYAITQAAQSISMYSYALEVTGMPEHIMAMEKKADTVRTESDKVKTQINEVIAGIQGLSRAETWEEVESAGNRVIDGAEGTADQIYQIAEGVAADPETAIQTLLSYGLDEISDKIFGELVKPLVGRYLNNGGMTGDQYLRSFHVIGGLDGLDFYNFGLFATRQDQAGHTYLQTGVQNSTFLDSEGYLWINVQYEVDYTFGALPLPFAEPKLKMSQTVVTKAWLGGSGEGYRK